MNSWCRPCQNRATRASHLKREYNLTLEDYDRLFEAQGGVCAICQRSPKTPSLSVDHDHKTGLVRGLVCTYCNRQVIGRLQPETVAKLFNYFRKPPAVRVLGEVYGHKGPIQKRGRRKKR